MRTQLLLVMTALAFAACSKQPASPAAKEPAATHAETAAATPTAAERLDAVLAAQPEAEKARYPYRHPKETLTFFGIEPGMTVVDTLPGDVWYTGILMDYLGPDGKVIAADYAPEMWAMFGEYSPDPKTKVNWPADYVAQMQAKRGADDAQIAAFQYGSVPDEMAGTADVVLLVRAVHHFTRMEDEGGYMTKALADISKVLKPGGIVGVVAHRAPESSADAWATGDQGYIKQTALVTAFEKGGFELVEASEINANPKDQPTEKDFVWRLSPTFATSQGNAEMKAQMEAIGESDRMTLKFRKKG